MVSESNHQQAVIKWSKQPTVRERYPELALLHHIKNETKEGAAQVAVDKAMGVKKACRICTCLSPAVAITASTSR